MEMMSCNTGNRIATTYLVAGRLWLDLPRQDSDEPQNLLDKVEHIDDRAYRLIQGMISLTHKHPKERVDRACGIALEHRLFRHKSLRRLVEQAAAWAPAQPSPIQSHEIIR